MTGPKSSSWYCECEVFPFTSSTSLLNLLILFPWQPLAHLSVLDDFRHMNTTQWTYTIVFSLMKLKACILKRCLFEPAFTNSMFDSRGHLRKKLIIINNYGGNIGIGCYWNWSSTGLYLGALVLLGLHKGFSDGLKCNMKLFADRQFNFHGRSWSIYSCYGHEPWSEYWSAFGHVSGKWIAFRLHLSLPLPYQCQQNLSNFHIHLQQLQTKSIEILKTSNEKYSFIAYSNYLFSMKTYLEGSLLESMVGVAKHRSIKTTKSSSLDVEFASK